MICMLWLHSPRQPLYPLDVGWHQKPVIVDDEIDEDFLRTVSHRKLTNDSKRLLTQGQKIGSESIMYGDGWL